MENIQKLLKKKKELIDSISDETTKRQKKVIENKLKDIHKAINYFEAGMLPEDARKQFEKSLADYDKQLKINTIKFNQEGFTKEGEKKAKSELLLIKKQIQFIKNYLL